jgi:hypothetical protein
MSSRVWMSSVKSNYALGDKPGVRTKFYGYDWEPAEFIFPPTPDDVYANMRRAGEGFALKREELPETAAVWNERRFKLLGDIFYVGGFLVVGRKLAEVLARFDLGEGGLIPFPIYKADLVTPFPGEFFLLNFGARKNSFLPEQSEDAQKWMVLKGSGQQLWKVNYLQENGMVAMSSGALAGADLWFEEAIHNKIFVSDALASALQEAGLADDWRLKQCRILEADQ